jgi:hypothetical protein
MIDKARPAALDVRILLNPAQLSVGYVGYTEVTDLAGDMTAAYPGWTARQLRDTLLAHGEPSTAYGRHQPRAPRALPPARPRRVATRKR